MDAFILHTPGQQVGSDVYMMPQSSTTSSRKSSASTSDSQLPIASSPQDMLIKDVQRRSTINNSIVATIQDLPQQVGFEISTLSKVQGYLCLSESLVDTMSGTSGYYKYRCAYSSPPYNCLNWVWVNNAACAACLADGRSANVQPSDSFSSKEVCVPKVEGGRIVYEVKKEKK